MSRFILVSGDRVLFNPTFGPATVIPREGAIQGSGPAKVRDAMVCVSGDEGRVAVPGCAYTTATHPVAGLGTLLITSLSPDQTAQKTRSGDRPVLLQGGTFVARFEVSTPAQQITATSLVPDPVKTYPGTGQFVTMNSLFQGT